MSNTNGPSLGATGQNRPSRRAARYSCSCEQIAAQYGVHPRTVRRWVAEGRIEARRIGPRLLRLDPDAVADALLGGDAA